MSNPMNLKMRDDTMAAWKSWLVFEVYEYMADKPDRYDIKTHLVSGSKSGYARNIEVYTGKPLPVKNLGLGLLDSLLFNKRYHT